MSKIQKLEDIKVWQESKGLALKVFELTSIGPFAKESGLRDQMRRAARSVMANIAQGFERRTRDT